MPLHASLFDSLKKACLAILARPREVAPNPDHAKLVNYATSPLPRANLADLERSKDAKFRRNERSLLQKLSENIFEGVPWSQAAEWGLPTELRYSYLGGRAYNFGMISGPNAGSSGDVIRMHNANGDTQILKKYASKELFENDLRAFVALRAEQEKGAKLGFYLPRIIELRPEKNIIVFEDTRGISVQELLTNNDLLSAEERVSLAILFRAQQNTTLDHLLSAGTPESYITASSSFTNVGLFKKHMVYSFEAEQFQFSNQQESFGLDLRPANFVVGVDPDDPTRLHFTLIDPK